MSNFARPAIYTIAQLTASAGFKVCVYGRAGVGKTRLHGTAPSPIIISAEKGLLSLRADYPNWPAIPIRGLDDLKNTRRWIAGAAEARQFATFTLDSITDIAESVLAFEMSRTTNKMRAYGEMHTAIMAEFREFRDLEGPNIYFVAKQETVKDSGGGATYRPWMPGQQVPQAMPYFFDEVFKMDVAKDKDGVLFSFLRTRPDAYNEAKDRSGRLDEFEPPNLTHIFNKMLG